MSKTALIRAPAAVDDLDGFSLGALPSLLGFHLRFANMAMYRDYASAMESLDLTQKQHAVLLIIKANHGVSQVDIAAALGTDRATMMAIVDRLEARDLVERQRSKGDRRRRPRPTRSQPGMSASSPTASRQRSARFCSARSGEFIARISDAFPRRLSASRRRTPRRAGRGSRIAAGVRARSWRR